jgi:hypothetical protein
MNTGSVSLMVVGTVLGALVLAQAWLLWRLTRVLASAARVEERVGHFADALSLLTETTESGFRAVAEELGRRRDEVPNLLHGRAATARVNAAARRGRSVSEIAAAEEVSEGEVRLRLHMSEQATQAAKAAKQARPVALIKPAAAPRTRKARTESVDEMRA